MTKGFVRLVGPTMKNCFPANKVQNYFIKSAHLLDLHILHCVVLNKTYEMICCKQNRPARDIQGIFERKKLAITRLKGLTALIQLKPKIKKNCDPLGIKKNI